MRFKSHAVHFSVKGTVAAVLSRQRKAEFGTTRSKGGRAAAKAGINRANMVAVPCRDGKRFPQRMTTGTSS